MRTHWMVAMAAAVTAAAAGAGEARADACLDAMQAPAPDRALMEPCLKSRPTVFGSIGGGVTLPGGWGAFATVDAPLPARLWASGRLRWVGSGLGVVDAMVGLRFAGSYKRALVWWTDRQLDATTVLDVGKASVVRTDWVLAGGVKAVIDDGVDVGQTFQVGLQRHSASGFGTHRRIEGYAVMRGGRFGAAAAWHNAIPPIPWLVFGMEAGLVPYESGGDMPTDETAVYWAMIDLGISFER